MDINLQNQTESQDIKMLELCFAPRLRFHHDEVPTGRAIIERYLHLMQSHGKELARGKLKEEICNHWRYVLKRRTSPHKISTNLDSLLGMYSSYVSGDKKDWNFPEFSYQLEKEFDASGPGRNHSANRNKPESVNGIHEDAKLDENKTILDGNRTVDYFDDRIGLVDNRDFPSALEFAAALLSEMLSVEENSQQKDKFRLGTIIVHLHTRIKQDFQSLYNFYSKIVEDVEFEHYSCQMVDRIQERMIEVCQQNIKFDLNILELEAKLILEDYENISHDASANVHEEDVKKVPSVNKNKSKSRKRGRPRKRENLYIETDPDEPPLEGEDRTVNFQFECNLCEFNSGHERNLDKHKFEVHNIGSTCSQCGAQFQVFQDYEQHTLMHVYHCEQCNQPFAGVGALRLHKQKHLPQHYNNKVRIRRIKTERKVSCKMCKEMFSKKDITEHIKEMHSGKDLLKCDQCDYTTWNKSYLKDHVKRKHFLQHISCTICGKVVKNLDKHIDRCHVTEGGLPCDQCGKLFAARANLQTHINNIHKQIKDYHCDQCTYCTYTKHNLRLHMKSHTGETSERECGVCGKTTNSIDWHMNLFHKEQYELMKSESQDVPKN